MENQLSKLKNWISTSFQLITIGLLGFAIILIIKQQSDISTLESRISDIDKNVYDIDYEVNRIYSKMDDFENKLDDVESNLISEIEDVNSTVRIWCN